MPALAAGLLLTMDAVGQVEVLCRLPMRQTLLHAPARVKVTLLNNTGRMLLLDGGREGGDLRMEVERLDGRIIRRLSERPLVAFDQILSGTTREFEFDVARLFDIQEHGTYQIRAVMDMGRNMFASADVTLAVVRGFELARMKAGVSGDLDAVRLYVLEYLQTDIGENLYLRIEDDRSKAVFGVFDIGEVVRTRAPEMMLNEAGNIHVLFQTKNMGFTHAAFTPYGMALFSETAPAQRGEIHLRRDDDGRVKAHFTPTTAPPPPSSTLPAPANDRRKR